MRRRLALPRGGPPRGRQYFALREAEGAQAGDCARHTRALDHLRAQEFRSQRPGEHHQGKKGRPQVGHGLWQRTRRAVSGGMSAVLKQPSAASNMRVGHGRMVLWELDGALGTGSPVGFWRRDFRRKEELYSCPSASGFFCRWGGEEESTAVPGVGREAPDASSSLSRGGWLTACAGGHFCGHWL